MFTNCCLVMIYLLCLREQRGLGSYCLKRYIGSNVIASNIEGPSELLKDGQLGALFEMGNERDLFEKLMQATNSKYDIIKTYKSKQELQNFDSSTMCKEYLDLYRRMMNISVIKEVTI